MIKIGLTGGIGSGKSVVSSLLKVLGVPVYIADTESKRLTQTSPIIRKQLISLLGETIYCGEEINKKRLASLIFNDMECRDKVQAIIHPEVNRHFLAWAAQQTVPVCAIETAILFESGFSRSVDVCVTVYAPTELRIERVMLRDGITREEVVRRINSQMSDKERRKFSDYEICNDGKQALLPQINAIIAGISPSEAFAVHPRR
ncbi:MAG: dephospho-CoA kinase [Tannerellaceae bacterium]|jgi:dephospho-CoA kinase|nr:dephospho-CoA kinase [Tannerellaceae bacterium]